MRPRFDDGAVREPTNRLQTTLLLASLMFPTAHTWGLSLQNTVTVKYCHCKMLSFVYGENKAQWSHLWEKTLCIMPHLIQNQNGHHKWKIPDALADDTNETAQQIERTLESVPTMLWSSLSTNFFISSTALNSATRRMNAKV